MKFVDEYRRGDAIASLTQAIDQTVTRPWTLMEICGGQTHTIVKYAIDTLLPDRVTLIHGPGCPVCVTAAETIDEAIALTGNPEVILCSYGDMVRVPGTREDLLSARARGGDLRLLYSPLDALKIAQAQPDKQVVFFAVGFETTAPATALAVYQAARQGLKNLSFLLAHVLVPPAIETLLSAPHCRVQGLLAAGHVCTVTGYRSYEALAERYGVPIVVTGFEPVDILRGIYHCLHQLEQGQARVENQYARSVKAPGNQAALELMAQVFTAVPQTWRGLGEIPASGLAFTQTFQTFDARQRGLLTQRPPTALEASPGETECISGLILQGVRKPLSCPAFGRRCTPDRPLGAPMVSSEGACAAYYRYRSTACHGAHA